MGEVWNEVGDRLGDVLFIGALAFVPAVGPGARARRPRIAAVLASFVGLAARAAGGRRLYGGVLSKPGRMIVLAVAAPLAFLPATRGSSPSVRRSSWSAGSSPCSSDCVRRRGSSVVPADLVVDPRTVPGAEYAAARHPRPARRHPGQRPPGSRPAPRRCEPEHAPQAVGHLGRPRAALVAGGLLRSAARGDRRDDLRRRRPARVRPTDRPARRPSPAAARGGPPVRGPQPVRLGGPPRGDPHPPPGRDAPAGPLPRHPVGRPSPRLRGPGLRVPAAPPRVTPS